MFYDRDNAFLVSMPFSNSEMPNGGHLGRYPSWNPPAPFLFYIHFTICLAFQNSATRTVISYIYYIYSSYIYNICKYIYNSYMYYIYNYFVTIYFYFVIFKSQIVIKNEIKFLIQNFVFLSNTHSKTL